ncbi:GNAT family N-acetyltransferase [Vibrio tritonius]|uniref:GNAT family N-acetyltransferase n=1 Tax=Vibrio tritonius TaxID=1435069 RepID=A0ABS7YRA0_9VIBR|nr:GNAT family N-acetyltransferase [Vibrio tritonius]MCA2016749.1 GNAT family N-acetyltransferase [Vibrio tritonius]
MIIRQATAADIEALFTLNMQIGNLHFANAPEAFAQPSEADKVFLLNALKDESRLFLVAKIDKNVVGYITATITQNETISFLVRCRICRIGTIVVDEHCRSQGIGQHLMQACRNWAKEQGAEQIRLEVMAFNESAQQFYTQLGFVNQSHIMCQLLD